jgi:NADP-dependent 3-hydroxy acid dehydrogenase YdfG
VDLLGQIVVVIGGSAGIGLETARRARAEGDVILTARNAERLAQAAEQVGAKKMATFDANDAVSLRAFFDNLSAVDHIMVTAGAPWPTRH